MKFNSLKEYPAIQYDGSNAEEIVAWAKSQKYTGSFGHEWYANLYKDEVKAISNDPDPAAHGLLVYDKDTKAHGLSVGVSGGVSFPHPGDWIVFDEAQRNSPFRVVENNLFQKEFKQI